MRIFVISLKDSSARRAAISGALAGLGLDFEFFDAVDGRGFDLSALPEYDGFRRRLFFGRDLTPAEMGCTLSHRAVMRKMVDEDIPRALILEDDALLSPDLPEVLKAIEALGGGWDMVRFLGRPKTLKASRRVRHLTGRYELTRAFGTPGGAYGYVLTKNAAARMLPFLEKNWQPSDVLLGQTWRTGLNVYAVRPSPVIADDDVPSTIGDERFRKTKNRNPLYLLVRMGYKMWENAGKRRSWARDLVRDRARDRREEKG